MDGCGLPDIGSADKTILKLLNSDKAVFAVFWPKESSLPTIALPRLWTKSSRDFVGKISM